MPGPRWKGVYTRGGKGHEVGIPGDGTWVYLANGQYTS